MRGTLTLSDGLRTRVARLRVSVVKAGLREIASALHNKFTARRSRHDVEENVQAVSVGRIVSAAEVGRHGHVVHDDGRADATARKHKEATPAEQPIALALNVEAGVLEQHMRIKPALENTEGHNGCRSENDAIQRLIRIIKYFIFWPLKPLLKQNSHMQNENARHLSKKYRINMETRR